MKSEGKNRLLAETGCKNTKSRKAVVEVLESTDLPVSAEEIHARVRSRGFTTNLSTVYRTIELLESRGLVEKSVMIDGKACFQLVKIGHRHHLVCTGCRRMIPITSCPLESLEKSICEATNFDITGHKLELYGLCPECKKA